MRRAAALLTAALLLGCSGEDPEQAFLDDARGYAEELQESPDDALVDLGRNICVFHDDAPGEPDATRVVALSVLMDGPDGMTQDEAASVYLAAIDNLCPEHS